MQKMNFTNNQTSFEYAMYIIAASYFKKVVCQSPLLEAKMRLQYNEQKVDKQCDLEDICINYMEKLVKKLPGKMFQQNMMAKLKKLPDGSTIISFMNEEFALEFSVTYSGKKSEIRCNFGRKRAVKAV